MARTKQAGRDTPEQVAKRRADQLLEALLEHTTQAEDNEARVQEILTLFRQFPNLACASYYMVLANWREVCAELSRELLEDGEPTHQELTPLHIFLYANLGLGHIQALLDVLGDNQDSALETECLNRLPIHVACRCASEDIILFLAQKRPDLLDRIDESEDRWLPFGCALNNTRHDISNSTLKLLLRLYPEAALEGFALTSFCGRNKVALEVLEYMVELMIGFNSTNPDLFKFRQVVNKSRLQLTLDLERTKILCNLLRKSPQMTGVSLEVKGWDEDAFLLFMKELERNTTLDVIVLSLPEASAPLMQAFFHALKENNSLVRVILSFCQKDTTRLRCWLDAIRSFCSSNNAHSLLQTVELVWQPTPRVHPRWYKLTFRAQRDKNRWLFGLETQSSDFSESYFADMVQHILSNVPLRSLSITRPGRDQDPNHQKESTRRIHSFLQEALSQASMWAIKIKGFQLDDKLLSFFQTLQQRTDSQLKSFQLFTNQPKQSHTKEEMSACLALLAKQNVILEDCEPFGYQSARIQYYLDLNRLGRSLARNASKSEMVDLLLTSRQDRRLNSADDNRRVQGILYGLLREAPGLWTHGAKTSPQGAKRKVAPL